MLPRKRIFIVLLYSGRLGPGRGGGAGGGGRGGGDSTTSTVPPHGGGVTR
jgi:hypothetical protein